MLNCVRDALQPAPLRRADEPLTRTAGGAYMSARLTAQACVSGGLMQLVQHRGLAWRFLMGLLGTLAGYITLALTSTLVQEIWLGGVSYRDSGRLVLILAGVFTPMCAFVGGLVGALVAGRSRWLAAAALSGLITIETTYLYTTQRVDGPLWFEAGAAAALILAVCAATWLSARYAARRLNRSSNVQ